MSTVDPGAGVGAPGAGSPPAPGSGESAGSPPAGGVAAPPAAPVDQLRQAYESLKTKHEPWERLGAKPEEVQRSHQTYTKLYTEASTIGSQLGYSQEELQQAFQADPVGTLMTLRQMAQQASGSKEPLTQEQLQKLVDRQLNDKLKPFQQEREQRLDSEATARFDGEFDRQFKTSFPNGLPDSNREAISGLAWALLSENPDAYNALRLKGDTSQIQGAFEQAKKTFLKIITDYGEHEKKRIGGEPPATPRQQPASKKGRSFAEIAMALNDDSVPDDVALGRR